MSTETLSLPVSDQGRARGFHVDVLGFKLLRDAPMQPGLRWVQVAPPRRRRDDHPRDLVRLGAGRLEPRAWFAPGHSRATPRG